MYMSSNSHKYHIMWCYSSSPALVLASAAKQNGNIVECVGKAAVRHAPLESSIPIWKDFEGRQRHKEEEAAAVGVGSLWGVKIENAMLRGWSGESYALGVEMRAWCGWWRQRWRRGQRQTEGRIEKGSVRQKGNLYTGQNGNNLYSDGNCYEHKKRRKFQINFVMLLCKYNQNWNERGAEDESLFWFLSFYYKTLPGPVVYACSERVAGSTSLPS